MAGKMCEAGRGGLTGPSRAAHDPVGDGDIEILGLTLPLAETAAVDWDQIGADEPMIYLANSSRLKGELALRFSSSVQSRLVRRAIKHTQ